MDEDIIPFENDEIVANWQTWRKPYSDIYASTHSRYHDILDDLFMSVEWRAKNMPVRDRDRSYISEDGYTCYRRWTFRKPHQLEADSNFKNWAVY